MFRNYLIVAFRNITRHKGYSLINILGLAIGMALCVLILLYVQDELSYDAFHENADRIYRVARIEDHNGDLVPYMNIGFATTDFLKLDFPDAFDIAVRIFATGEVWTKYEDRLFKEGRLYVVDGTMFDIFTFDFLAGQPENALNEPNTAVLNQSTAEKYFGTDEALGKMITVDMPGAPLLKVTAVVKDLPPQSHFHPDILVSLPTIMNDQNIRFFESDLRGNTVWSYILLREGYPVENLESRLPEFLNKNLNENQKKEIKSFYLQPLRDIHLRSSTDPYTEIEPENTGNVTYLYIFSVIAVLVLLVACINFMNMATARSARRAHEVGLRKVVGAHKSQLVKQFIGESLFISLVALPLALALAHLSLPVFNSISGKEMTITYLNNPILFVSMLGIVLFVGFVAGSYPAFFLSSFRPINVLKGKMQIGRSGGLFRKILVVGQFAVSIGFVVGVLIVLQQLNFMRSGDLGFDRENVLVLNFFLPESAQERMNKMEFLKNEYLNHPAVLNVAKASGAPSDIRRIINGRIDGMSEDDAKMMVQVGVDYEYLQTLNIDLLDGRDFSREFSTDLRQAYIINEAVAQELGLEAPIGKTMYLGTDKGTIIGVMKSVHWEPKRRLIFPMVFLVNPQMFTKMVVRISHQDVPATLAFLEQKWNEQITTRPFEYQYLEDMIDSLYKSERRLGGVVLSFAVLSILIACLGLFGLASFTAEQKTKEIGIRKVMGATVPGVVLLLSREFGKLILIANIIAWPLSYYALRTWLQNFYYRITIGFELFLFAAVLVMLIAFVSISYQSIKAALTDPATAIRYE